MASSKEFLEYCLEQIEASLDSSVADFGALDSRLESNMPESSDLRRHYTFTSRKMFGEYCIYVRESKAKSFQNNADSTSAHEALTQPKPIFLLCDDTLFAKPHKILDSLLPNHPKAPPFPGAKQWYIMDIDNLSQLRETIITLTPHLAPAKAKKSHK